MTVFPIYASERNKNELPMNICAIRIGVENWSRILYRLHKNIRVVLWKEPEDLWKSQGKKKLPYTIYTV